MVDRSRTRGKLPSSPLQLLVFSDPVSRGICLLDASGTKVVLAMLLAGERNASVPPVSLVSNHTIANHIRR
jgi:hypothetical protein